MAVEFVGCSVLLTCIIVALTNSALFCEHGGLGVVLKSILDCYQFPRINESLLSVILYLLNWPQTRHYVLQDITLEVCDTYNIVRVSVIVGTFFVI